jgi:hypothetical protein
MILKSSKYDLRFLELYENLDLERQKKWLNSDPKNLLEANVRRFKHLLALNLSGKAHSKKKIKKHERNDTDDE